MKKKTVQLLAFATVAAVGVGVVSQRLADKSTAASGAGERLLPALDGDGVNDVAQVAVEAAGSTLTFQRDGADWKIEEKSGWPAKPEKVRALVLGLRQAEVVERKTSDSAKFEKLGLVEPDAEGSSSKRVTLRNAAGDELASVLIGNRRASKAGMGAMNMGSRPSDQFYALPSKGEAAVLMSGKLTADARLANWAETEVLSIGRERIKAVRVAHAGGAGFEAARDDMEASDLTLLEVPEGQQPKSPSGTMVHLNALSAVRFDDVRRADAVDWTGDTLATAEFFTEHGLRVRVETVEEPNEDKPDTPRVWARYSFDVAPDAAPVLPGASDDEADDTGDNTGDDTEGSADETAEPEGPTPEELEQEARDLSEATSGWAFALPTWKAGPLRTLPDAVFQPIPAPDPGNGPVVETPSLDDILNGAAETPDGSDPVPDDVPDIPVREDPDPSDPPSQNEPGGGADGTPGGGDTQDGTKD